MLIAPWPLFICILGILIWVLVSNPKINEIGRWMMILGMMWFIYTLTGKTMRIG